MTSGFARHLPRQRTKLLISRSTSVRVVAPASTPGCRSLW
jgi:hypothetical protein